ncbi:CBS domain-containing protein [Oleispirillum naphthae]|uniref:CBS domain-containing protein n=1 Tax=Oleispirillum naphthae TaxID=2838853 RepID=UPI003082619E
MTCSIASVLADRVFFTLPSTATAREAAQYLADKEIGAVTVVDDGQLVGVLSERDLVFRIIAGGADADRVRVADIMTRDPITVQAAESLSSALTKMRDRKIRHLPVMDGEALVGMMSIRDVFAAMKNELEHDLTEREAMIFGLPM